MNFLIVGYIGFIHKLDNIAEILWEDLVNTLYMLVYLHK